MVFFLFWSYQDLSVCFGVISYVSYISLRAVFNDCWANDVFLCLTLRHVQMHCNGLSSKRERETKFKQKRKKQWKNRRRKNEWTKWNVDNDGLVIWFIYAKVIHSTFFSMRRKLRSEWIEINAECIALWHSLSLSLLFFCFIFRKFAQFISRDMWSWLKMWRGNGCLCQANKFNFSWSPAQNMVVWVQTNGECSQKR